MADESVCCRLVPQSQNAKEPNTIEVYVGGDFSTPKYVITARFPVKPAKKNDPVTFANGRFDGVEICPRNPAMSPEESPFYILAYQYADVMTEEDSNGTMYFYDIATGNVDRSKFMI